MKNYVVILSIVLFFSTLASCNHKKENSPKAFSTKQYDGIDVSHHQEKINLQEVEANCGYIDTDTTFNLVIYYPHNTKIDLVCEKMPSKTNEEVIFCAEAAFTGQLLDNFSHDNIMGPHVCGGIKHKGYGYSKHYGAFVAYKDKWFFSELPNNALFDTVVANEGMAFTQYWVIKNSLKYPTQVQKDKSQNYYRVIADVNGDLCIIDSKKIIPFSLFLEALVAYGVTNALYMDMGSGWNHSFWRERNGTYHEIHPYGCKYCTNWLTIYK